MSDTQRVDTWDSNMLVVGRTATWPRSVISPSGDREWCMLFDLERDPASGSAVASHSGLHLTVVATWSRKAGGGSEDAPPTFVMREDTGRGLLAVYDGLGGAGAASYPPSVGGAVLSEAHVAARAAKAAFEEWFEMRVGGTATDSSTEIEQRITANLRSVRNPRPPSRVRGTLRRELPTTLASVEIVPRPPYEVGLVARWAGDSRAYVLEAGRGLHQISRDDTAETDALEILTQNPPLSNAISLDRPFRINHLAVDAPLPTVVVCATDGCFGYVDTPALFEHVLLDTLVTSTSAHGWADALRTAILRYTQDDTSMVIAALGFRDHAHLVEAFRPRAEAVRVRHWLPYARLDEDGTENGTEDGVRRERLLRFRRESWAEYRDDYSYLLPPPETVG